MEFRFGPAEEAFRQEVRQFLQQELPRDRAASSAFEMETDQQWEEARAFTRKLAQRGWLALHWPREYGGQEASVIQQLVFNEEMAYQRAPMISAFGTAMLGPILILYGTEEQKRQHLRGITSGEVIWCQGYSEPSSGSDLASLQTRAVRDGDDYVINGQKIWTSQGHRADRIFLLARTDPDAPKHKGISFFLVDMKAPGVTVRPLINLANLHTFNEVFFEDVRVPKENLVGEENRGWYLGVTLLDFERSEVASAAFAQRDFDDLLAYLRSGGRDGGALPLSPALRHRLAEMAIEIEAGRMISYRVASIQAAGGVPNYEASMAKLYHSELAQRLARVGSQVMGLYGQLRPGGGERAPLRGHFAMTYLTSLGRTIAGGTSEIQRNIMATRGLGLPRG